MTIENKLRDLIVEKFGNISNFCRKINMANSTFATIMRSGIHNANVSNIIKICKALEISADELANDNIVPIKNDPILEYARLLSKLSTKSRENALNYIDYLVQQDGIELLVEDGEDK